MARTQAKVLVTIWSGEEWRETTSGAQRLYLLLLSQSRLNLAGCIDLMPTRWASLAPDTTTDDIERHLAELERRRFVAIDRTTDELVVRTFTEHDLASGALNKNLVKGFWSAWAGVMSAVLRKVVVDSLPDLVWSKSNGCTPNGAEQMRTSDRLELPLQPQSEPQFQPKSEPENEPQSEPSVTVTTTATAYVTNTAATADRTGERTHADPLKPGGDPMEQAARILAEAEADRRGTDIGNRAGYVRARTRPILAEHERSWRALLEADPTHTATDLATGRALAVVTQPFTELPDPVPVEKRDPIPPKPADFPNLTRRHPDDAA